MIAAKGVPYSDTLWKETTEGKKPHNEGIPVVPNHYGYKSKSTYLMQPVHGQQVYWSLDQ